MKAYKGFSKNMTCRGFQYKEGETFRTDGVELCHKGFHACEHPLDVLQYYSPDSSVYHEVELNGEIKKEGGSSTKVVASEIKIGVRLSIAGLVKAAIDYTMSRIKPEAKADEDSGAASATGYSGAASATGYRGAASATGYRGAASATGDRGAASAENATAIAVAWGIYGRAKGVEGSHIVLADWRQDKNYNWKLHGASMIRIDGKKYKADTWYTIINGKVEEVE